MNNTGWVVEVPSPGGADALRMLERAVPKPGPTEILIEVHAAGINRGDIKQREGDFPKLPSDATNVLGLEVAGTVLACGVNVHGFAIGDRVCALLVGGGYAQYCVAPAGQCLHIPPEMEFTAAAAIPETFATVWLTLFEQARLQPGETVLIHGGASGIGTTAIQLASRLGSQVLVTAGTPEKCAYCERLGAQKAINYRESDFVDAVMKFTNGAGVDVVLDMIGGPYASRNLQLLKAGGRLAYVAGDGGGEATFNIREIMMRRLSVTGATLRHRSVEEKSNLLQTLQKKVWPLIASGQVTPVVGKIFPFDQVADAHRCLEEGHVVGKVILKMI
ncbi:MAG TPA: NAD(P)H-quinone oxidoreductase [Eoetvoesiella sp.]